MGRSPESRDYPVTVAGIDWTRLNKGDRIPRERIEEAFGILFPNRAETEPSFRQLAVKDWLEKARLSIAEPLVFKQQQGDLVVLTDEQAVGYLNGQAVAGLRKHRTHTGRMFTHVDVENLSQYEVDQLGINQMRHSHIASAVDGAKRQVVNLIRSGKRLPKLLPPDS